MYKLLLRFLFLFPPEWVHYFSMNCLRLICSIGFRSLVKSSFSPKKPLPVKIFDLAFSNPVGLGAGFDKNAKYLRELDCLGFGFVEIGTVTPVAQGGNEKPRLFRLPKDKALINRMGFNNDGVEKIAGRLKRWKESQKADNLKPQTSNLKLIIGGNIGKNKNTPNEFAWKDYETCFRELHPYVDYFVVNVSSPNTPGLRELQGKESLRKILTNLQGINNQRILKKPLLLKISLDLSNEQLDDVINLALEIRLDGLVAANTTISRDQLQTSNLKLQTIGAGGLSGLPLKPRSTDIVKYINEKTGGKIPIIASGGIFTATDANEKISAGASLIQVWTGFIYEGPGIVRNICRSFYKKNN